MKTYFKVLNLVIGLGTFSVAVADNNGNFVEVSRGGSVSSTDTAQCSSHVSCRVHLNQVRIYRGRLKQGKCILMPDESTKPLAFGADPSSDITSVGDLFTVISDLGRERPTLEPTPKKELGTFLVTVNGFLSPTYGVRSAANGKCESYRTDLEGTGVARNTVIGSFKAEDGKQSCKIRLQPLSTAYYRLDSFLRKPEVCGELYRN